MPIVRKYNIPALFCALAVLLCALSARPYADMAVCDDGPYILMARTLANTGHIVYNGWGAPMLGWQLYLAAAFIKLFGFSFTAVRMSTVLVSVALAFVLQRTLVAAGITERNASIGTLALVLSPFYLILSVTFMSDITGLFGIVICVYGCLRALQASSDRATIGWIAFAVLTNAIFGSSRQISWLGILVMVPSTLWLRRSRRRVLLSVPPSSWRVRSSSSPACSGSSTSPIPFQNISSPACSPSPYFFAGSSTTFWISLFSCFPSWRYS
jgi:hypothetical protein